MAQREQGYGESLWFTANGEEDGKPLIFRGRQAAPAGVTESDYPFLMTVYWPYDPANEQGMPDGTTNVAQVEFEDAVSDLDLPGLSILMLVVTGNGRKAWHWYASDVDAWMEKLNDLLMHYPEVPISIENSPEPDWILYHGFMSGVKGI